MTLVIDKIPHSVVRFLITMVTLLVMLFAPIALLLPFKLTITALVICSVLVCGKVFLANKSTLFLLLFYIFVFLSNMAGYDMWALGQEWFHFQSIFLFLACGSFVSLFDHKQLSSAYRLSMWLIAMTALITIVLSYIYPDIVRLRFSKDADDQALTRFATQIGMMTYGFGHAISVVPPMMVYMYKKSNNLKAKLLALFFILVCIYAMFVGTITIALIFSILATLLAVIYNRKKHTIFIILLSLGALIVMFGQQYIVSTLEYIQPYVSGQLMEGKIISVIESLSGKGSTEIDYRLELRDVSIDSFLTSPIFGNYNRSMIGAHAFVMDYLSFYGLFVFALFILAMFFAIKKVCKYLSQDIKGYYLIANLPLLGLAIFKGYPAMEYFCFLFLMLPLIALYFDRRYIKE